MSNEEFKTDNYLEKLRLDIIGGRDSFIAHSQDKNSDSIFVENCLESINIARESLVPHLFSYDINPFWIAFLNDWKPNFEIIGDYKENFLKLSSIIQVIVEEVRVNGRSSTVMRVINNNIDELKSLSDEEDKFLYFKCLETYEKIYKSSILFWRLEHKFEEINNEYVSSKFKEVETGTNNLKSTLESSSEDFDKRIKEIDDALEAMKEKAGFLSLYAGFDKYAIVIKKKLRWLAAEKVVWVLGIGGAIMFGLYLNVSKNIDWISLIPLGGMILFCSTLLRVNLKKTDQYEQIMSKVEHKLAVSTFYQQELKKMEEGKEKEAVNGEYYKFLFSNIETTEWNTPDIVSDIATILKSYKR